MKLLLSLIVVLFSVEETNAGQCQLRFRPYSKGYCLSTSVCPGAVFQSLCPSSNDRVGCCVLENFPDFGSVDSNITKEMFMAIFNNTDRSQNHYNHFVSSLGTAGVISCHQQSAYITQIAYDTNFLTTLEESSRNIRKMSDAEFKYIGRGAIHISGEEYYHWMKKKLHINVVDMPEELVFPSKAFWSASLIWAHSYSAVRKRPLNNVTYNSLSDGSKYGFLLLSYYLKGKAYDTNKLLRIWRRVNQVLGCPCVKSHGPSCKVDGREGLCKLVDDCKGKQVEDYKNCKGPVEILRCSLDYSVPVDVLMQIKDESLLNSSLHVIMKRIHKRIKANPDSRIAIRKQASTTGHIMSQPEHQRESNESIFTSTSNISQNENIYIKHNQRRLENQTRVQNIFRRKITVIIERGINTNNLNYTDLRQWNQTGLLLHLSYRQNPRQLTAWDGLLDYEYNINEPFIEERLLEKILNGPWHLNENQTTTLQLEKNETIYLAISYHAKTDAIPLVSINKHIGSVNVTGVKTANQLPGNQDYHCCANCAERSASLYQDSRKTILLLNPDDESQSELKAVVALLINSKVIIVIRGMEDENVIDIRVKQTFLSNTKDQDSTALPVVLGSLWIVICSFLAILCLSTIINAAKCYQVSQKTICKVVKRSDGEEQPSTTTDIRDGSLMQHQNKNRNKSTLTKKQRASCVSYLQISANVADQSDSFEDRRCLRLMTYIQLLKVLFIMVFYVTFITGSMLRMSKTVCSMNILFASFASNSLYAWILLEALLGLNGKFLVSSNFKVSVGKSAVILVTTFGMPAVLAAIPFIFIKLKENRQLCCWWVFHKDELWIEISVKGILFMLTIVLWLILLVKETCVRYSYMTHSWRIGSNMIISILFTTSCTLSLMSGSSDNSRILLQYLFASCNFVMGIFILVSLYQQTKENVENLQRKAEYEKRQAEDDDQKFASPAISRYIINYDECV